MTNPTEEATKLISEVRWSLNKAWSLKGWDINRLLDERDKLDRAINLLAHDQKAQP